MGAPNSDKLGDQEYFCRVSGECIAQHNALHDAIFQIVQSSNLEKLSPLEMRGGQEI